MLKQRRLAADAVAKALFDAEKRSTPPLPARPTWPG